MSLTAARNVTPERVGLPDVGSRRRAGLRPSRRRHPWALGVAVGVLALTAACTGPSGAAPEASLTPSPAVPSNPVPSSTPTVEPSSTPAAAPSQTAPPTATPSPPPQPQGPTFHAGARVGDLPSQAPEYDAVRYLTESLGVEPHVVAEVACETSGLPGRTLGWEGTGVQLRVRTTDDSGAAVPAYAAAWTLTEGSADVGLGTEAGLQVGDPEDRVLELYPDAARDEWLSPGTWWYRITQDAGTILVVSSDHDTGEETVHWIESGYGCGE